MAWVEAAIGLGSNVGQSAENILSALQILEKKDEIKVVSASHLYRTPPWGETDQPWFLNACALVTTSLSPQDLLSHCKKTENEIGRQARYRWGPREIDVDILTYGGESYGADNLTIPHRELMNRAFVLVPLSEIAADMVVRGTRIGDAAAQIDATGISRAEPLHPFTKM